VERGRGVTARAKFVVVSLAAGAVVGFMTPPRRLADASSHIMIAASLWHDWDLVYTPADLRRAQQLQFADLPAGLFLTKQGSTYTYGKPLLYPLAATPWFALFGVRGFLVLNGLLLASLVWLGAAILAPKLGWQMGVASAAVVIGFSVTPAYLHWIDPFLFYSCLVAGGVAAYRQHWPACSATLLVMAASCRFPYLALAAAPIALHLVARRWSELRRFVVAGLAAGVLLLLATRLICGQWSPYIGERYSYGHRFPYEAGVTEEVGIPFSWSPALAPRHWPTLQELARNVTYFFVGRFSGLVLYFPTFLACLLWIRTWDKEKVVWLSVVAASCLTTLVVLHDNFIGGRHALGNRLFVLLPVALILVDFVAWRPLRVAGTSLLLLLVVPVMQAPVYFSIHPGRQMLDLPYRLFPLEWAQVPRMTLPFNFPRMGALTGNQYDWEPSGGLWTVGGRRAEFVLVRRADVAAKVGLSSLLPKARVADGGVSVEMEFAPGVENELTLAHPVAVFEDQQTHFQQHAVYALTIETAAGIQPAAYGASADTRSLGVFVRPMP
jgi:hypothetical protein